MVAQPAGPSRPPGTIEEFLWNMHSVLIAQTAHLAVDSLKDVYSKQVGHKCNIERWLVVGDGGLAATLKRIPHIVTIYQADGITCIKSAQAKTINKEQLIEADAAFRRELQKKNAAAKSAKAGTPVAAVAPAAAKAPNADASQAKRKAAPAVSATAAKAAPQVAPQAVAEEQPASNGPAAPKRSSGPSRQPASIEDFLWNLHCVLESFDGPLPVDQLQETYSKHLGHKLAVERFLVVGDIGLAGTLKRIPHIVTVSADNTTIVATLPQGSTKEALIAADQAYRKTLQQKNQAAKAAMTQSKPTQSQVPVTKPSAPAPAPAVGETRPAEGGGEPDAKRQKPEDHETLSRMLVQGVIRVLQNRLKEGKGPLLVKDLPDEFKELWKVPFNLQSAGYTEVNTFLKAWPNKIELTKEGTEEAVVSLVKKSAEKAKAEPAAAKAPATATKAAPPTAAPVEASAAAKKSAPAEAPATAKKAASISTGPPAKASSVSEASSGSTVPPPKASTAAEASATSVDQNEAESAEAKKARGEEAPDNQLSRMLIQGVIRVLQNRTKEGKGPLLLADLPEEFKTLWKVSFNLQNTGYSDVVALVKAWSNKLEIVSTNDGDFVQLIKKSAERAKSEGAAKAPGTDAKSAPPVATVAAKKSPAVSAEVKAAVPAKSPPPAEAGVVSTASAVPSAASLPAAKQLADVPAKATAVAEPVAAISRGDTIAAGVIPRTAPEIRKELQKTVSELESIATQQKITLARQLALVEALNRIS